MPSCNGRRAAAIIPLGHNSRCDSSSLPEGCSRGWLSPSPREDAHSRERSQRAGPALPSYLALHHAGFSVPPMLPTERWALTPPFHPCLTERAFRRRPAGFPARCHRSPSRRYILCGTFRSQPHRAGLNPAPHAEACNSASWQTLRGEPPGVTRRVALYPEAPRDRRVYSSPALASLRRRCPDFPPAQPSCNDQASDHPAHPPI